MATAIPGVCPIHTRVALASVVIEALEGDGDEWPGVLERVLASDILVMASPTWLGHPSSVAQRALERLDALPPRTSSRSRERCASGRSQRHRRTDGSLFRRALPG